MMEPDAYHLAERATLALESMAESLAHLAEASPLPRIVMESEATVDQTDEDGEVYLDPREARYGRSEDAQG